MSLAIAGKEAWFGKMLLSLEEARDTRTLDPKSPLYVRGLLNSSVMLLALPLGVCILIEGIVRTALRGLVYLFVKLCQFCTEKPYVWYQGVFGRSFTVLGIGLHMAVRGLFLSWRCNKSILPEARNPDPPIKPLPPPLSTISTVSPRFEKRLPVRSVTTERPRSACSPAPQEESRVLSPIRSASVPLPIIHEAPVVRIAASELPPLSTEHQLQVEASARGRALGNLVRSMTSAVPLPVVDRLPPSRAPRPFVMPQDRSPFPPPARPQVVLTRRRQQRRSDLPFASPTTERFRGWMQEERVSFSLRPRHSEVATACVSDCRAAPQEVDFRSVDEVIFREITQMASERDFTLEDFLYRLIDRAERMHDKPGVLKEAVDYLEYRAEFINPHCLRALQICKGVAENGTAPVHVLEESIGKEALYRFAVIGAFGTEKQRNMASRILEKQPALPDAPSLWTYPLRDGDGAGCALGAV